MDPTLLIKKRTVQKHNSYKASCNVPTKEEAEKMLEPLLTSMGVESIDQLSEEQRLSMCEDMLTSFKQANPEQEEETAVSLVKDLIG